MILAHIIRAMDDDGARFGIVVLRVQPDQTHCPAMLADILLARHIGARTAGQRIGFVGKAVQPAAMRRVRSAAMRHQIAAALPADQVDDMEAQFL